jgi:hypothetical protein
MKCLIDGFVGGTSASMFGFDAVPKPHERIMRQIPFKPHIRGFRLDEGKQILMIALERD